jgi:hypothetical protein
LKFVWAGADFLRLEKIAVLGFFGGAAVLSAWAFSPGRRRRQPGSSVETVNAAELWKEKALALAAAVFGAAVVACLVQAIVGGIVLADIKLDAVEPVLLLVVLVCSAVGWAAVARSVVGGLVLSGAGFGLLYLLIVVVVTVIDSISPAAPGTVRLSHSPGVHTALMCTVVAVGVGYAVFMLRVGKRKFAAMERPGPAAAKHIGLYAACAGDAGFAQGCRRTWHRVG